MKEKTTTGKFIDRLLGDGDIGVMGHEVGTVTILKMTMGIIIASVIIFSIKKYVFKLK